MFYCYSIEKDNEITLFNEVENMTMKNMNQLKNEQYEKVKIVTYSYEKDHRHLPSYY